MSRHLYDLEKLMDSDHGLAALENTCLYKTVVLHRSIYNRQSHVDCSTHDPKVIILYLLKM